MFTEISHIMIRTGHGLDHHTRSDSPLRTLFVEGHAVVTLHHKPCLGCGKVMEGFPSAIAVKKYCSRACASKSKAGVKRVRKVALPTKVCLNCGGLFSAKNPSSLKTRMFCSRHCDQSYKVGDKNPNWRGGKVELICKQCGEVFLTCPSLERDRVFCSRRCLTLYQSTALKGENNRRWMGGRKAAKARFEAKQRASKPPPVQRPLKLLHPDLKPVFRRKVRYCKRCGQPGVKKHCKYHPECRPRSPNGARVVQKCKSCGVERRVYPSCANNRERCWKCSIEKRKGSGNPNWKGGITPENQRIRHSERYKAWRLAVFKRDEYTCVLCDQKGGSLHAHHIKSFSQYPKLRFDVSNGQTLCIPCHEKTDSFLSKARKRRLKYRQQMMF
jgi:hypothetical protein